MIAFDEMRAADGAVRPAYAALASWLDTVPPDVLDYRRREAEFIFRRIGITFAVYGDAAAQEVHHEVAGQLEESKLPFEVSFLFGGQIAGRRLQLFLVYSAGNFIECTQDTPYLQIGEHKYGKPILDRAVKYDTDLYDALKIGLISMDSTMRSNLAVGLPIDLLVLRRDALKAEVNYRIEPGEPYFHDLRERWSAALRAAHIAIPRPPYGNEKK